MGAILFVMAPPRYESGRTSLGGVMPGAPFYRTAEWRRLRAAALARDGHRCTVPGCGSTERLVVDHILARPRAVTCATQADGLINLRTLCARCDASIKEGAGGARRRGGALVARGCDADGWPRDPDRSR